MANFDELCGLVVEATRLAKEEHKRAQQLNLDLGDKHYVDTIGLGKKVASLTYSDIKKAVGPETFKEWMNKGYTLDDMRAKIGKEIGKPMKDHQRNENRLQHRNAIAKHVASLKNESADSDELKLSIYESCYSGEITEEERDELLNMM